MKNGIASTLDKGVHAKADALGLDMHPTFRLCTLAFLLGLLGCLGCQDEELDALTTEITQVHHQGGGSIDLLFVVDNSGSMRAEQEALANTFSEFIRSFEQLRFDFRIAVTTTDAANENGRLRGRVLSNDTQNLEDAFAEQILVGTDGFGVEQGFRAAQLALSEENLEGEDFLRPGALLAIIFVSDEDDQSFGRAEDFYDRLVQIKGDVRRVKANAIVGPRTGGCANASPGLRYLELVELSGGAAENICQDDLGIPRLGQRVSGFNVRFPLAKSLLADTEPRVLIDGEELESAPSTWEFINGNVDFAEGAEPEDCSVIEILYSTRDLVENPGEPLVIEAEPAICAESFGPRSPRVVDPDCTQGGALPLSAFAFILLILSKWRSPRPRRRLD